jgi:hypothetical protein
MRDSNENDSLDFTSPAHRNSVHAYDADRIADDANRIADLMALTGLSDDEYNSMCSLYAGRFNSWNPRTYDVKLDDNIPFLVWATLCEVEGCTLVAHPCECGGAHCADHPHIGGNPL